MVVNGSVRVTIIEQVELTESKHEEKNLMSEDFPFYPSYKPDEIIFVKVKIKEELGESTKEYKVIDIRHSIHQILIPGKPYHKEFTYPRLDVYVRKVI